MFSSLDYISGVILFSETLTAFNLAPLLIQRGIIPGVRVDLDGQPCPGSPAGSGEVATQGHDDLLARCQAYHAAGARFTKWRAPFLVNESGTLPSPSAIEAQAEGLAKFAAISQMAGLVPIIEPDLAFEGDASLQRSVDAHVKVISAIYAKCAIYGVLLEGTLLKPSFPQPGLKHPSRANIAPADVGLATAAALARSMPITVAGVVFLSGGLSDAQSVQFLDAVNKVRNGIGLPIEAAGFATRLPPLTFSFGRGLQGNAMEQWANGDEKGAQDAFAARAKICSDASKGQLA